MIRRPPRSTPKPSSAASDVYKRQGYLNTVTVSPDGSLCASGGKDGTAMLWDLKEGKRLYSLDAGDIIHSLVFSPNRYWLCAATTAGIKVRGMVVYYTYRYIVCTKATSVRVGSKGSCVISISCLNKYFVACHICWPKLFVRAHTLVIERRQHLMVVSSRLPLSVYPSY